MGNNANVISTKNIRNVMGDNYDVKIRELNINKIKVTLAFIDGLVDSPSVSEYVVKSLLENQKIQNAKNEKEMVKVILDGEIYYLNQTVTKDVNEAIDYLASANALLIFDKEKIAIVFDTKGFDKRSIVEPSVENVIKGAKDSFVENIVSNTSTVRRKIQSKDLVYKSIIIGNQTNTPIVITYMKNIANDSLVSEVEKRLNKINTDSVITTSVIEEALSEDLNSMFPQVLATERPDKFCADILEGRIGVLIDGIPNGLIVPATIVQFLQAPEDYSKNSILSSITRVIRYFSILLSLLLPALYIAITTFNIEMIPSKLALFIAKTRMDITFPISVETLLLLIAFELLYEAGLRVPRSIGPAVSIVGTLVVGQAAVEASLLSPSVVVIIAATSIASFTIPNQDLGNTIRVWRFILSVAAGIFGLLGCIMVLIIIVFKLCKLESFGVPYLSPYVSSYFKDMRQDTIFRIPIKENKIRPKSLNPKNLTRQGD